MSMNWYLDPYAYAVSMNDLCSLGTRWKQPTIHDWLIDSHPSIISQDLACTILLSPQPPQPPGPHVSMYSVIPLATLSSQTEDVAQNNVLLPFGPLLHDHQVCVRVDILHLFTQNRTVKKEKKVIFKLAQTTENHNKLLILKMATTKKNTHFEGLTMQSNKPG